MLTLECEIYGRIFEARRRRKIVHCRECAERLRKEGRGPIQQKSKGEHVPAIQALDWSKAGEYVLYYLKRFGRSSKYDGVNPDKIDEITDQDRTLANQIAARIGEKVWHPLVHKPITEIGRWDLLCMSDLDWQARRSVIRSKLAVLLGCPGIGVARLTKALHRKRPDLIPICDRVLCKALTILQHNKADKIIECMEKLRQVGQRNLDALSKLRELTRNKGTELTELRILEILHWVEFGPFRPDEKALKQYLRNK